MLRRTFAMGALGACALPRLALAQSWPTAPVRVIVPYAAGGGTDAIARMLFKGVGERVGKPFVIDNKPGAGGTIGYGELARAAPDGSVLGIGGSELTFLGLLYPKLPFSLTADMVPVAPIAWVPVTVVVNAALPVNSIADLVALAKRSPAPLAYATPGVGTTHHLAGALMAKTLGIPLEHVPYKGTAPALTDVAAGHVPIGIIGLPSALPYAKSGALRPIGVATHERVALAPNLPTLSESGLPGFEATYTFDVQAPKGLSPALTQAIYQEIRAVVATDRMKTSLAAAGFEPLLQEREAYLQTLKADGAKWAQVTKQFNITVQ